MKKIFCCPALKLFHCLPLWKTVLFVSSRAFSLSTPTFLLSTPLDNSEATWKKATKCNKGTCVAVCPAERSLVDQGTCQQLNTECHNCVAACPADRPFSVSVVLFMFTNVSGFACYETCPLGFPDSNGDMVCGIPRKPFEHQIVRRPN